MKKILFIFVAIMPVLAYGMRSRQEMSKELEEVSARLSASLRFIDGVPYGMDDQQVIPPDEERFLRIDYFRSRAAVARARNTLVGFVAKRLNSPAEVDVPGAAEEKA